jgi:hypothetical protein
MAGAGVALLRSCPPSLGELRRGGYLVSAPMAPWGGPLLFGCVGDPPTFAPVFVPASRGPDRRAGTLDGVESIR